MFFPISGADVNPLLLVALGLTVGICSGFFGIGGGFMITPALNMFGLPMPFAIGTGLALMMGSSVISTLKHRKMGHVDLRLGMLMVVGTMTGVEAGKQLVLYLERIGEVGPVVRYIYIIFLVGLGLYMLKEARKTMAASREARVSADVSEAGLAQRVQSLKLPPALSLPTSGIANISIWIPLGVGFATGVLAGTIGVGGGFIRMPALIYIMGVPTVVAVGTDLFEIIISGAYGAFTYALANRLDLMVMALMLVGSSAGVQVGTVATRYVHGARIRFYFAITILLTGLAVILQQASVLTGLTYLWDVGLYLLLGAAFGMGLVITALLVAAKTKLRSERRTS